MNLREIILLKVKDLQKIAIKNNMKTKFIYKKVLENLEHDSTPIMTLNQIKNIPNVGPKTYNILVDYINKELEEKIINQEDLEKFSLVLKKDVFERIKQKINTPIKRKQVEDNPHSPVFEKQKCEESEDSEIEILFQADNLLFSRSLSSSEEIKTNKKQYIPGFRTGAYAIMRALWEEDGISKHKIAHIGKNFTDCEFDFTEKASAWSSIKTLITKELVYKESGSKAYFLTDNGKNLAQILFKDHVISKEKDKTITLLIDSREIKNRTCRSFFQSYFDTKNLNYETRNLSVGDFVWIQNENVCNFVVERKCGPDLISSIIDGRFKEQKKRLLETGFKRVFYIIEGLKSQHMKKINEEFVRYCIVNSKIEGFTVIETKDINETAEVIRLLDRYVRFIEDTEDFQLMSYGTFIDKGSKNRALSINCILFYMFLSINGLSQVKARMLSDHFKTPKNVLETIKSKEFESILKKHFLENEKISKRNYNDIINMFCK
ncbi:Crossover junction endonuclease MUS81 [Nosema granulosis]|uniref:Crossover junction endonuclease MUS81 n=1 Tax=Nosema granulosis TaxID=83296 RepID=A0A9P6KY60_9MICR|nr:Crossover junction endonuclease MUS81 [Nosema granulosis]